MGDRDYDSLTSKTHRLLPPSFDSLSDAWTGLPRAARASIGPGAPVAEAKGQVVLDRSGYSVLPGLVGMHDHLHAS